MPSRPCPICGQPTSRALDDASRAAYVNYYRCDKCGAVWNTPKTDPHAEPHIVTTPSKD